MILDLAYFDWDWKEFFAVFVTLFAVIDILGSIPILISLKEKWVTYDLSMWWYYQEY